MTLSEDEAQHLRRSLKLIGSVVANTAVTSNVKKSTEHTGGRGLPHSLRNLLLAAAIVAIVATGWSTLVRSNPQTSSHSGSSKNAQTEAEAVACAALIAEVVPRSVRPASSADRQEVVLVVRRWIKPARGNKRIQLNILDPAKEGKQGLRLGERQLIVVPTNRRLSPDIFIDRQIRLYLPIIQKNIPRARGVICPKYWRETAQ